MTPPTPEQITAWERWARENGAPGLDAVMSEAILALCETVREMQAVEAELGEPVYSLNEPHGSYPRRAVSDLVRERDAAVARAEQAEADEDDLCARLNAALDAAGVDVGDEGYGAAITVLAQQRDVARAEIAHERLRYDGMRSDRDDWRKRCEVAIARCLYIDRAGRTSDGHR